MDAQSIASLPEFFREVRRLKGTNLVAVAGATGLNPSTISRLERSTSRPALETLEHLAHRTAYGCPWWSVMENQTFLRALGQEFTGLAEYAADPLALRAMYFVRPIIPHVSRLWFTVSAAREVLSEWPGLGLPGWKPAADTSAPTLAEPLWWWSAYETYRAVEEHGGSAWSAKWTAAVTDTTSPLLGMVVGGVAHAAAKLGSGWQPTEEEPEAVADQDPVIWWDRYREAVLELPLSDQVLIKMLVERLVDGLP